MPHALTGGLGGEGAGAGAGAGAGGASSFFAGAGAATTDAAVLAGLSSLLFGVGVHADADAFKPWLEKEVFQSDKCDVQIGKLRLDPHHPQVIHRDCMVLHHKLSQTLQIFALMVE